jgi:hypothetical protein
VNIIGSMIFEAVTVVNMLVFCVATVCVELYVNNNILEEHTTSVFWTEVNLLERVQG